MTIVYYDKWENGEHIMATAYNDITGDNLVSRGLTKEGEAAFERIFGVKERKNKVNAAIMVMPLTNPSMPSKNLVV